MSLQKYLEWITDPKIKYQLGMGKIREKKSIPEYLQYWLDKTQYKTLNEISQEIIKNKIVDPTARIVILDDGNFYMKCFMANILIRRLVIKN